MRNLLALLTLLMLNAACSKSNQNNKTVTNSIGMPLVWIPRVLLPSAWDGQAPRDAAGYSYRGGLALLSATQVDGLS